MIFYSPNGTNPTKWRPGSPGRLDIPTGTILSPLKPYEDQLIAIGGLNFYQATNHEGGQHAMLTNQGGAGDVGGGASIDQYVATQLGGGTPLRSLELGVLTSLWGGGQQTRMSYANPSSLVTPDDDPRSVYRRVWGDLLETDDVRDRLRARRASVLDAVRGDLSDLQRRLGASEREKLEQHVESLRSVEQGLFADTEGACVPGDAPDRLAPNENHNAPAILDAQIRLAVEALTCGVTNVASIQFSHTVSPVVFDWLGQSEGHHSLSHIDDSNTEGIRRFVEAETWCAEQFAKLVGALAERPDPSGEGSMLDSTVVVWAKEMGDPRAHVCTDVPFVIAGGAGGCFRTGRYIEAGGQHHAHLLVSILNALGIEETSFGDAEAGTGALSELSA